MTRLAVFEPYYSGSHRSFIDSLTASVPYRFDRYTLPGNRWKWRMRLAAPFWAEQIRAGSIDLTACEGIFCSSFLDVATFKGMLPARFADLPVRTYFHENQFAYPVQENDPRDIHFALTNLTTALSSDSLAFNSKYNLESFLGGCREFLSRNNDMRLEGYEDAIRVKSVILPPPIEPATPLLASGQRHDPGPPVIVWNHRWEHDKDPDFFFAALFDLYAACVPFRLVVLGESFRQQPEIFNEAKAKLANRILHFGYVSSRAEYLAWLQRGDIVVSTARHEFFGLAVLEAVRAGCCPLLPNRLAYPELFETDFLYEDVEFRGKLRQFLERPPVNRQQASAMTDRFSWRHLSPRYERWLAP